MRLLFPLVLAGCAAGFDLERATTLPKGTTTLSAGVETQMLAAQFVEDDKARLPWLQAVSGIHHGLTEDVEIGARIWGSGWPRFFATTGGGLDVHVQLRRAKKPRGTDVLVGPSVTWHAPIYGGTAMSVVTATVPVAFGWSFGEHQLWAAPRVGFALITSAGQHPVTAVLGGGGIGAALRVSRRLELCPQATWQWSPLGFDGAKRDPARMGGSTYQTGMSFRITPGRHAH